MSKATDRKQTTELHQLTESANEQ